MTSSFRIALAVLASAVALIASGAPQAVAAQARAGLDEREVLAAVDRFFAAVHDKDRARILAAVVPEGQATAIRLDGGPAFRSWHWATYAENALAPGEPWTERLIAPEVRIERDLAMVWGRYELTAGERFSHCGVDHFELVRRDGRWLIYNLTWTNQAQACPGR